MDPQIKAKQAISRYFSDLEENVSISDVMTVWFCYILGGWKTLMFINKYPTNYFEVTYSFAKGEMYLDHYRKVSNHRIPDAPESTTEAALQVFREKLLGE